jgi:hypothetical protein
MTGKSKLLLTLAAGPLLGAVVFLALTSRDETPPAVPEAVRIPVPWHQSTRLMALELKSSGPDTVDVLTRRDAKTGTTYVLRRIDCRAREFQYLGEGTTEAQAREGHGADTTKNRLTEGSISFYVAAYACPGRKRSDRSIGNEKAAPTGAFLRIGGRNARTHLGRAGRFCWRRARVPPATGRETPARRFGCSDSPTVTIDT